MCPLENIPIQKDTYNCGVYFRLQFYIHREYLKTYLLKNSEDMTNICLYCNWHSDKHRFQQVAECVEWVSCSLCCRLIAINCIPKENRITLDAKTH
ncbi:ULP PROTEASE domain-containing protein [Aphis craccivora]|uniref:ULP PROTEASE domain-containing protein n=1 Tax=Aphis craccivora TaxID=307492 RepID=A0A6G0VT27_APHCR|nr:ULP PROTEASE domain-containing protein [Aphis craccivora]